MNRSLRRCAALLAAVVVCSALPDVRAAQTASQGARRPAAPQSVRLYVLDGGTLESDPGRYRLTKEDVGVTQLSIAAYLVVHPKGVLLWDAGAIPDGSFPPSDKPVPRRLVLPDGQERFVSITRPLGAQLADIGYAPADVTHLALSHYHWDHTANANAFAGATWLVRQAERDAMMVEKPAGAVIPETYASLRKSRTVVITASEHDVFGDGTVILKAAPGHTPGHQVIYLKLARTGGVLLSGDLYHYRQERTLDRLPVFEFSEQQTSAARRDVEAFLKKTGAELWIQHDLQAHEKLRKAPAYYD